MGLGKQLSIAGGCARAVITHPFTLVYPALTAFGVIGTLLGLGFVALSMATPVGLDLPSPMIAWAVFAGLGMAILFLGLPLLITTMKVAYCYEIHELYQGRRPMPGEGLVVALRNPIKIILATVIIATAFNGGRAVSGAGGAVGDAAGSAAVAGSHVLSVFMAPAIAIEDADARETAQYVREAVAERWGVDAYIASNSVSKISGMWFVAGLAVGVLIIASGALGVFPLDIGIGYVIGLGLLSPVVGFFLAALTTAMVSGLISTALYVYAVDGETPDRIGLSIDQMAQIN